jgi:hypothetical protein
MSCVGVSLGIWRVTGTSCIRSSTASEIGTRRVSSSSPSTALVMLPRTILLLL